MVNPSVPQSPPQVAVFFYGSYMNGAVLRQIGLTPREVDVASLSGFDIDVRPLANVVPSVGQMVWGIVTTATHAELEEVYAHARDVLGRVYLPHAVLVEVAGGAFRPALCYIGAPAGSAPAANDYLDRVIAGARENDLPAAYIERLERFRR
jgi:cation transport regulator ChaC